MAKISSTLTDKIDQLNNTDCGSDKNDLADDPNLDEKEKRLLRIMKLQDDLHKLQLGQEKRNNFKWYVSSVISLVTMIIVYFYLLPAFNYLYLSTKEASELKTALNKDFIPENS
jgi:hypothetical protein